MQAFTFLHYQRTQVDDNYKQVEVLYSSESGSLVQVSKKEVKELCWLRYRAMDLNSNVNLKPRIVIQKSDVPERDEYKS